MKVIMFFFIIFTFCNKNEVAEKKYKEAITFFHKKDLNQSLKLFTEVKKIDSEYKDVRLYLGKIYYYAGKFEEASKNFERASNKNPENINLQIWTLKSNFAYKKQPEDIKQYLKKTEELVELDSNNIELLLLQAKFYFMNKNMEKSIAVYRKIIQLEEEISIAYFELAKVYEAAGLEKEKKSHFTRAITLSSNNKKLLKLFNKGIKNEIEEK